LSFLDDNEFKLAAYYLKEDSTIVLIHYLNDDFKVIPYEWKSFKRDQNLVNRLYQRYPVDKHFTSDDPNKNIRLTIASKSKTNKVRIKEGKSIYIKEKREEDLAEEMDLYPKAGLAVVWIKEIINGDEPAIYVEMNGNGKLIPLKNIQLIKKSLSSPVYDLTEDYYLYVEFVK